MKRVAVTGLGLLSPIGNNCPELLASLKTGRSGISLLEPSLRERLQSPIAASVELEAQHHFPAPQLRMMDRVSQFALYATRQAVADAGLSLDEENHCRIGVSIGTSMGGAHTTDESYHALYKEESERLKPFTVLMCMTNAPAAWIASEYGLTGPNLTYSTACSSSAVSIGEAWTKIRNGEAEVMIAGGAEAPLTYGTLKAWEALRTLASQDSDNPSASCKPFARNRDGLVLGEGSAIVILEEWEHARKRGARIYAELTGYGLHTDCSHITRPSVSGQANAMRLALESAGMAADEIGYVNAHGTGTQANDKVETEAIKQVFGQYAYEVPVSSTKSMHGHLLGAAGAIELVVSILAMESGVIPPTLHLHEKDPECDLDYVPLTARENRRLKTVMSNSFAFGGTNAVLIARAS